MIIDKQNWYQLIGRSNLPVWRVQQEVYYHKIDAVLATSDVGNIKYDCFHGSLDRLDWSVEPPESYQSLCQMRARQIRESNDWVRVWYSGGADSHTALMSFFHAGCYPDEVITMRWSDLTHQDNFINIETDRLVIPSINQLKKLFPRTIFRVIDYRHDWFENNMTEDWHQYLFKHEHNCLFARNISVSHDLDPTLLDQYQRYNRVANITGEPKPNLLKRQGEWWATLIDNQLAGMHGIPGLEMFHLSPDFPELFIKQCHMLKRGFESKSQDFDEKDIWRLNQDLINKNKYLERHNEFDLASVSQAQWQHGKRHNVNGDHGFNVVFENSIRSYRVHYYNHYRSVLQNEFWGRNPDIFCSGNIVKNSIGMFSHFWSLSTNKVCTVDELFANGFDL